MDAPLKLAAESEPKNEAITVKLTATELRGARLVASVYDRDVGPMLRDRCLNDILAEAEAIKARLRTEPVAA